MQVTPTPSRMTDTDPTLTYLVRALQTRHSSHRGNFTNPHLCFPVHDHSFIHAHACIHAFIHTFIPYIQAFIHPFSCMHSYIHSYIHPYIHLIHPSIAYAIIASQHFASRHKAVVISFDMSGNRLGFEGWPAKGSRPPRIEQSQGRKHR